MSIEIIEYSVTFPLSTLGPDLNSRAGRNGITARVSPAALSPSGRYSQPTPANLQGFIDLFGEQVTVDPVADLGRFFQVTQARGFGVTPGGLTTGLSRLAISPSDVKPSITTISVVGEGLAGWCLLSKQLIPISRPVGEGIDLVYEDTTTLPRSYALTQVKATQQPDVSGQMNRAVPELLQYGFNLAVLSSPRTFYCYMIGVIILPMCDFQVLSLKMDFS